MPGDDHFLKPSRLHLLDIIATAIARKTSGNSSDAIASDVLDDLASSSLTVVYELGDTQ